MIEYNIDTPWGELAILVSCIAPYRPATWDDPEEGPEFEITSLTLTRPDGSEISAGNAEGLIGKLIPFKLVYVAQRLVDPSNDEYTKAYAGVAILRNIVDTAMAQAGPLNAFRGYQEDAIEFARSHED